MKGERDMEMLERYVYDVGRRLPAKQREDIEKELKSLLMDALEARTGGREPNEADVAAVLKEFGQPADVAMKYTGEKYLIGPKLYPTYRMVLGIVLGALALGLSISIFIGYALGPASGAGLISRVWQFLGSLVSSGWGAIGIVTVIFWGIERGLERGGAKKGLGEPWDPKSLPPIPKHKNPWKPAESIAAIVFSVIALILFNGFPQLIAIYFPDGSGEWQRCPVLSQEALAAYLPLWNIGWALAIALHAVLLMQGRWRLGTNLANVGLKLYDIAVLAVMLAGPALLNTNMANAGNEELTGTFKMVFGILQVQFKWIFIVIMIVSAIEAGKGIYRIVKEGRIAIPRLG